MTISKHHPPWCYLGDRGWSGKGLFLTVPMVSFSRPVPKRQRMQASPAGGWCAIQTWRPGAGADTGGRGRGAFSLPRPGLCCHTIWSQKGRMGLNKYKV